MHPLAQPPPRLPATAYMTAVRTLFERIGATLPAGLDQPVRAILVGGAAVHVYARARVSHDVEAIFSRRLLLPQDLVLRYTDESGSPCTLAYDYNYFQEIGLLHLDYAEDALLLGRLAPYPLELAVLSAVDLAVSKLARFQDNDREDIATLARAGLLSRQPLAARAEEALAYYVGDDRWVRHHLADALQWVQTNVRSPPAPGA